MSSSLYCDAPNDKNSPRILLVRCRAQRNRDPWSGTPRWAACASVPQSRSRAAEAELTIVATQADDELFFAVSGDRADDVESDELRVYVSVEYSGNSFGPYQVDTEGDDTATAQVFETGPVPNAFAGADARIQVVDPSSGLQVPISVNESPVDTVVDVPFTVRCHPC